MCRVKVKWSPKPVTSINLSASPGPRAEVLNSLLNGINNKIKHLNKLLAGGSIRSKYGVESSGNEPAASPKWALTQGLSLLLPLRKAYLCTTNLTISFEYTHHLSSRSDTRKIRLHSKRQSELCLLFPTS